MDHHPTKPHAAFAPWEVIAARSSSIARDRDLGSGAAPSRGPNRAHPVWRQRAVV